MSGTDAGGSRTLFALVAVSILLIVTGTVVGAVVPGAAVGGADTDASAHADPDSVDDGRDLSALERQMAERLASRARSGSLNISRENAQQAREAVNNSQYASLLNEYASVANETGNRERALAFQRMRNDQLALSAAVEAYWETYERYETVTSETYFQMHERQWNDRNGGSVRGPLSNVHKPSDVGERELARQLEREWQRVNDTRSSYVRSQRALANRTDENVTGSLATVNASVQEIETAQQTVRDEQFVATNLTIEVNGTQASFRSPLNIEGRLTTASGRAVSPDSVQFAVGNQTIQTQLSETGLFDLHYRPTTVAANTSNLTVRYRPENSSVYLGDQRTIPVSIDPVRPNMSVNATPTQVRYNDTVAISGRVGAEHGGAAAVPYLVSLDGRVLATGTTETNGTYNSTVNIPASVSEGTRTVRVDVPLDEQALLSANGTTKVDVQETATTLNASAVHVQDRSLRVSGSLLTGSGQPVANQDVSVVANGTTIGTVSTGPNGTFGTTLSVPQSVGSTGVFESTLPIGIEFRYDGSATNLRSATAGATVTLPTLPLGLIAGAILAIVAVLAGGVLIGRKLLDRRSARVPDPAVDFDSPTGRRADSRVNSASLLDTARGYLDSQQTAAAARVGYVALRQQLSGDVGRTAGQTPWEFYRDCTDGDIDETTQETLQRATELYEQARFRSSVESVSASAVEETLQEITSLVTGPESSQSAD
ncbi:hypothetical protein [Haloarcula sediminis]|uniref:hypothetical protein n=1 Tax=Haloarcula sediminis TaxID=3111777 RepID=UPI002D780AB3|nr:hypothetical protein [Haloarcula sp. CK38]